ncbi:MAG: hypothetical protein AB7E48_07560 [Deferribacterales bacterium]
MRIVITAVILSLLVLSVSACAGKQTAPGQIQKETGYNPKSGKVKK